MAIRTVACIIVVTLLAAPVSAQDRAAEAIAWQSLVATLSPGTLIEVRMKDGNRFKGTFVQRLDDRLIVKPRTRVAVPAREIAIADVESMATAKQGMSPAKKVLAGIAAGVGFLAILGLLVAANSY